MADTSGTPRRRSAKRTTNTSSQSKSRNTRASRAAHTEMVTELSALSAGTKAVISSLDERDLAAKTRVHQLAKLIGHTSKEVIALLGAVGINVRSAQSTVTREQVAEFRHRVQAADKGSSDPARDDESENADTDKGQADKAEAKTPEEDKSEAEDADAGEANVDESAVEETEAEKTDVDTPDTDEPDAEELETESSDTAEDREANHVSIPTPIFMAPTPVATESTESRDNSGDSPTSDEESTGDAEDTSDVDNEENDDSPSSYRRRRGRRGRGKKNVDGSSKSRHSKDHNEDDTSEDERGSSSKRSKKSSDKGKSGDKKDHKHDSNKHDSNKRKDKNKKGRSSGNNSSGNGDGSGEGKQESQKSDEPAKIKGSTRAAAARKRREENKRDKHQTISTAEFQARRDAVHRRMIVRDSVRSDGSGKVTQVAIMEDDQLVEHFVTSERTRTLVGNIYLGRVQNVLASMEAAFVDIGTDRNGVIYSGDIDWRHTRHTGRQRKIEKALKPGDPILVQVTKDSVGHKGPRLTSHISLAGRYLVYVPEGRAHGVSRKLPEPERKRLKKAVSGILPDEGGAIIRTAAEGVDTEDIARDVRRQQNVWDTILEKADELRTLPGSQTSSGKGSGKKNSKGGKKGSKPHFDSPQTLHEEPNLLVKVVRDLFNEDFDELIVDGDRSWSMVSSYIHRIAPDLEEKLSKYERQDHDGQDAFGHWGIDKQLKQALDRVVFLPSGGTLVIEKTEAMTVIDVNTGRFTGSSGSLEETVTRNNLEAADEIVRQMRLRDIGGMIVVDFIDMVLEENQELVLRRLSEALAKDRTRHQLGEVTSLGLVQITRKRLGKGLVETFSTPCSECHGRGFIVHDDPILLSSTDDDESDDDSAALQDNVDNDLPEYSFDDDIDDHVDDASSDSTSGVSKNDRSKGDRSGGGRSKKDHAGKGDSGTQSHFGKQGGSDETTTRRRSIEEIAAAAVILADDEDPDEPSGADYLSAAQDSRSGGDDDDSSGDKDGRPRRRRRRKATRSSRSQREEQVKADHTESDSAKANQPEDATKRDEENARHADGDADKGSGETTTRGKKQRGRRHATRRSASQAKKASSPQSKSRNKDASQAKDEHQSKDASRTKSRSKDSGESSSRSRDKKSSSADTSSQHKETYEEAQRQFDRSPRRRRATRGNSRSDVPPEKDNYPDGKTDKTGRGSSNAPDQKQSDKSSADNRSERSDKRDNDSHSGSSARKSGRRRARRRASTKK
ncbi:translation initiation factor IF-2 N-terminal domain-containing protein [Corynebacterium sp. MC-04]|uniref:Translation initiation factor IF-2 N-terminal domain-containing protein n=1 Tax=Corynebacterium parakroppenstedtii TaxID=2828363 RepID=A0ABS9HIT7_9CORY|nr:translation initiation factor IF-2 N-terminal domain-containing protein [Corynebacterium parakroppenstedtii]MCZ9302644.1 translation initiation factor IF-2 N-terminal domain-containing protein [Corynebacterium sp. c24U_166]MDU3197357.1 translation initiation factor IF-2 N-terminal domain-containing protein [Corynebacterium kroppenstedtii]MBY0792161.1 translation initiation factor IF-2 N-terminal domain-containing protein [Corynebacterium parakroppenstedtii]MCF6769109.1 translation initiation